MNDKQIAYTISILQQEAAERDERITELGSGQARRIQELEQRAAEQTKRINRIEAEAIANLSVAVTEQGKRIEQLETEAALNKEQRLQVVANAAVITKQNTRIEELEQRTVELVQRLARLEVMHNLNCE